MPWDKPGWFWSRLKEAIYQGLSWPYLVAITFTASALRSRDPTLITASIGMWSVALGRRIIQQAIDVRAGNGLDIKPPAYIHAPAGDDDPTR